MKTNRLFFGLSLTVVGIFITAGCQAAPTDKETPAPMATDFTGITDWVGTKPLKLADLKGKVVVVHFFAQGCINCVHNYPYYRAWSKKYAEDKDFVLIGIHTPEFDAEKDLDRLKGQLEKHKLTFPVAIDNDFATWKAWKNEYWPAIYLIDAEGRLKGVRSGELDDKSYAGITELIDANLAEARKAKK